MSAEVIPEPALALIEVASIARGHVVADAMLKRAPVGLVECRAVSPGKFLVLVDGPVAAVDEAFRAGLAAAEGHVVDSLYLPQAHEQIPAAVRGEARKGAAATDALGIVETLSVASTILAADAAAKAAAVRIVEMQLGRGIGGKGFFTVMGALPEIQAALEAAVGAVAAAAVHATEIIARPHEDLAAKIR